MRASRQCSTLGSARVDFLGNGRARRSVEGQVVQTESGRLTDKVWSQSLSFLAPYTLSDRYSGILRTRSCPKGVLHLSE